MTEQWIDAATAVSFVTDGTDNLGARRSLCIRAHSGLLQTRARLLVLTEGQLVSRQVNAAVPQEFWWAEGDEALEQNWTTGDFSTSINGRGQIRAFSVTFALSGMLELLPADKRALAAHRLSVAGDPAWVKASEARRFAYEKADVSIAGSGTTILDHARLGFVSARAVLAQRFDRTRGGAGPVSQTPSWEECEWDVPVSFWREFTGKGTSRQDWERGIFEGSEPGPRGASLMRLEGVHFLAESLHVLVPAEGAAPSEVEPAELPAKSKSSGRLASAFWEDMLCDVWALIYQGDFEPKAQADVERAMRDWAIEHRKDPGESTIRLRASKVFHAYTSEAKNFIRP